MSRPPHILVTNWVHDEIGQRLAALGEVDINPSRTPWPRSEVLRRARPADAILAFMPDHIDGVFLAGCARLKVIACALKGFDNFDVAACSDAGVWVTVIPDLLTAPTAELAVGMAIALGRMIRDGDAVVRAGEFDGWRPILYGTGLDQSTVSIVGLGAVGRAIAMRLAGFGCRVLGVDPDETAPPGVELVDLKHALSTGDYVMIPRR